MPDQPTQPDSTEYEELERAEAELLPSREAMSIVSPGPLGGPMPIEPLPVEPLPVEPVESLPPDPAA